MNDSSLNKAGPQRGGKRLGSIGRWLPGVLISAIAIYALFKLVNPEELGLAFRAINLVYLIPGALLVLVWLFLRALALKVILNNQASIPQTFRAINVGYLLNNILPLRAGELGKAVVLGRSSGLGASKILSGIVIERAFDLFCAAALLLAVLPLVLEMSWTRPVAIIVLALVAAGLAALYAMARNNSAIVDWIGKIGGKWPWVEKVAQPQIASFLSGFAILTDIRRFLLSLLAIGASWGVAVVMYYVMMLSIIPAPPFWWGVFVNSVLAMGIALPSAPAALGVFEASVVAGLKVLGIGYSQALAYAVVMHFLQILITGIAGVYGLVKERQSLQGLFSLSAKSSPQQEAIDQ
jgi:uncharacterized protein (TIRG00374 family)